MNVIVTPNFRPDDSMQREYFGDVVRLERLEDGKWGVLNLDDNVPFSPR
jgi:hypothetical protein